MNNLGKFITLEGVDGAGKTTHVEFIKKYLSDLGVNFVMTREPGGTLLGEQLREILLHDEMSAETETLLMFASRNEHIEKVIRPNLTEGKVVISDRFTDATYAYQGAGRGLSAELIGKLESLVQGGRVPDTVILLDMPPEIGMARARARGALDRFEQEEQAFFERVRQGYLDRAARFPDRYIVVDAAQDLSGVQKSLEAVMRNWSVDE